MRIDLIDRKDGSLAKTMDLDDAVNRLVYLGLGDRETIAGVLMAGQEITTIGYVYKSSTLDNRERKRCS